jgi:hypothetical protein
VESKIRRVLVAIAFALATGSFSLAHAATSIGLSGYEVSNGDRSDNITVGAVFAGWTTDNGSTWFPLSYTSGNTWAITANYQGHPGFIPGHNTNSVDIIGGSWILIAADGTTLLSGSLNSGTVTWPANPGAELNGCGKGVAVLDINVFTSTEQPGTITGCLDDTHLHQVFPPKVWGTLTLQLQ